MALPNATWDGQKIVTVVSRFAGVANDSQVRAAVLDYINLALWDLSLQTPWDWNALQATDQTVTAGVADYPLPTGAGQVYDDIYDVRLVGANERTLFPADRRSWDRYAQGDQDAAGVPTHYGVWGAQRNGVLTLFPTPGSGDTLRIRYIARQAIIADSTGSSLAMADRYIPLVIFKGAENVAAWKTPDRVSYWNQKYQQALARAINADRVGPDEAPVFSPQVEHGRPRLDQSNLTDLDVYPRGW